MNLRVVLISLLSKSEVTDAEGLSDSQQFQIVVNEINQLPVLQPIDDISIDAGQSISVQAVATDNDVPVDTLTFELTTAPEGATVSSEGLIQWTTTDDIAAETFAFTVRVSDGNGGSATESFNVLLDSAAPILDFIENQEIDELESLQLQLIATDPNGDDDDLIFELVQGPVGSTLDSDTGLFEWTPNEFAGGFDFFVIQVRVTDAEGLSDSQQFQIVVNEINQLPVLQPIDDISIDAGQSISVQAVATDNDVPVDTLTFELTTAPEGATVSSEGLIQWTTADDIDAGTFAFTFVSAMAMVGVRRNRST